MKKSIALILSIILILALAIPASAISNVHVKNNLKPATLEYYTYNVGRDYVGNYLELDLVNSFMKKYPNIKVNFHMIAQNDSVQYMQKTDIMYASGQQNDILAYPRADEYASRVRKDMLAPLDEYIAAGGQTFNDMFSVDTSVNGKIYALPTMKSINFVMINKKYLDAAGLSVPKLDWTWDDYRTYAMKMTTGEGANKRYGSYMHTWPDFKIYGTLNSTVNYPMLKDDGASNITDPDIKAWLLYMQQLENVDKCQLPYSDAKAGKLAYRDVFFQGKAAMIPIGSWMIGEIAGSLTKYPHDWPVVFAPIPKFKNNSAGATNTAINFISVSNNSKNKAQAYEFAKYYSENAPYIIKGGLPCQKGYNLDILLKTYINGKDSLYDINSLKAVLNNSKSIMHTNIFPYSAQVTNTVDAEFEKFLVGGETVDQAITNADKAVKDVIAASK